GRGGGGSGGVGSGLTARRRGAPGFQVLDRGGGENCGKEARMALWEARVFAGGERARSSAERQGGAVRLLRRRLEPASHRLVPLCGFGVVRRAAAGTHASTAKQGQASQDVPLPVRAAAYGPPLFFPGSGARHRATVTAWSSPRSCACAGSPSPCGRSGGSRS